MSKKQLKPLACFIVDVMDRGGIDVIGFRSLGRDWTLVYLGEEWVATGGKQDTHYFEDTHELLRWLAEVKNITEYKAVDARWFRQVEKGIDG